MKVNYMGGGKRLTFNNENFNAYTTWTYLSFVTVYEKSIYFNFGRNFGTQCITKDSLKLKFMISMKLSTALRQ